MQLASRAKALAQGRYAIAGALLCLGAALTASAQEPPPEGPARMQEGVYLVDGKPFLRTAAWWGYNHWMAWDPDKSIGNFLGQPAERVGTGDDFYSRCGFSAGYYTLIGDDVERNRHWLELCIERARKTGQKVVIHFDCRPTAKATEGLDYTYVTEKGERKPIDAGFHYDPEIHAAAMRARLKPMIDIFRDEPTVIGYQIGGETWATISYEERSVARFREFLKAQFTLEELSLRYGGTRDFFTSWEAVTPPIHDGQMTFDKRPLPNGRVAKFDWARYNKQVHEDVWVAMVGALNEVDGRGRPISYEYNHGPYSGSAYGLYNFNFAGVCDRAPNFAVGPGEFAYSLAESMHGLYTKTCGQGPWFTNELGAGYADTLAVDSPCGGPAYVRRHTWWTLALGGSGYHFWTFYNLLGAYNEFTTERYYDPVRAENLPPAYFEAQHCNKMVASLGEVLAGSTSPPPTVGLLYLDDSSMAGYVGSYKTDSQSVMRALASHGLADELGIYTEYDLDTRDLSRLRAIILPRTPRVTDAHVRKLAQYVRQGGTLLMMAPTGKVDELCHDSNVYPNGELAEACGVRVSDLRGDELHGAPVTVEWGQRAIAMDVETRLTITPGAKVEVLATAGTEPVATAHVYGKGRCVVLAGKLLVATDDDATGEFVVEALRPAGVLPAAALLENGSVATGVYAGRRTGPQGTLLTLIENADRAHELTVTLDPVALGLAPDATYRVFECFSDEAHEVDRGNDWTFATQLEPVGVRVYLVTSAASLDDVLPRAQRMMLPRDNPDLVLSRRGDGEGRQDTYRLGDAYALELDNARLSTITAAEAHAGAPRDLGGGYLGLDLDGYCTDSLSTMMKDVDYSGILQFGAAPQERAGREALPLTPGRNALGEVPIWVSGRYIELGKRNVEGIPVGARVAGLSFFQHGIYWLHESTLGYYLVHYADGSSVRVPIALFTTLTDLTRPWGIAPKTTIVWRAGDDSRLSRYDWENPTPGKVVTSVDIVRTEAGRISVWGITARAARS